MVDINLYHELRKENFAKARELVRKVLKQTNGNVSKTARILRIDRKTVRRARDGTLNDPLRKPKKVWNKVGPGYESLIVKEDKEAGFGYRRLARYLFRRYGLSISENTVRDVLKRNRVERMHNVRTEVEIRVDNDSEFCGGSKKLRTTTGWMIRSFSFSLLRE